VTEELVGRDGSFRGLLEIDLGTDERRSIVDGAEPFPDGRTGIMRFGLGGDEAEQAAVKLGLRRDSWARLPWPSTSPEDELTFSVVIRFFFGDGTLVLIDADQALPRPTLDTIIGAAEYALRRLDPGEGPYFEVAAEIKDGGRWVLEQRIRDIEGSVRAALDDEEFTPEDTSSLREYPQRLARVEVLAARLREGQREWESDKPKTGLELATIDWFDKEIVAVAQNARDGVGRLSGLISSQQIVLSQRQSAETARFQRLVTIVGAAVVVPGLVAAVFGANVGFKGRGTTEAFWAMLLLMVGFGVASYALLRSFELGVWGKLARRKPMDQLVKIPPYVRLALAACAAVIALAAGALILADSGSTSTETKSPKGESSGRSSSDRSSGSTDHRSEIPQLPRNRNSAPHHIRSRTAP
jgi:hypothetical protein